MTTKISKYKKDAIKAISGITKTSKRIYKNVTSPANVAKAKKAVGIANEYIKGSVNKAKKKLHFEEGGETEKTQLNEFDWDYVFEPLSLEEVKALDDKLAKEERERITQLKKDIVGKDKEWDKEVLNRIGKVKNLIKEYGDNFKKYTYEEDKSMLEYINESIEGLRILGFGARKYANEIQKKFFSAWEKSRYGQKNFKFKKGGFIEMAELPSNIKDLVDLGKVTYRGNGFGNEGVRIKVDGKEYNISDDNFKLLGGISKIKFKAPARKYEGGGQAEIEIGKVGFVDGIATIKKGRKILAKVIDRKERNNFYRSSNYNEKYPFFVEVPHFGGGWDCTDINDVYRILNKYVYNLDSYKNGGETKNELDEQFWKEIAHLWSSRHLEYKNGEWVNTGRV